MATIQKQVSIQPSRLNRLKGDGENQIIYNDKNNPGLQLVVSPKGKRTWYARIYVTAASARDRFKLADFDVMTHEQAVEAIERAKKAAKRGSIDYKFAAVGKLASVSNTTAKKARGKTNGLPLFEQPFVNCAEAFLSNVKIGEREHGKAKTDAANRLLNHFAPMTDNRPIRDYTNNDIAAIYRHCLTHKTAMFTKLRRDVARVFDYVASVCDGAPMRSTANWNHIKPMLGRIETRPQKPHPTVPIEKAPNFYNALRMRFGKNPTKSAEALAFIMLTGCRCGEVCGQYRIEKDSREPIVVVDALRWRELRIDGDAPLWTIPGRRTKNGRTHRVPLAAQAVELLRTVREKSRYTKPNDLVFRSARGKHGFLSDNTVRKVIHDANIVYSYEYDNGRDGVDRFTAHPTPHGLRSTLAHFGMIEQFPTGFISAALNHVKLADADSTDASINNYYYERRAELRRPLMQAYADYIVDGVLSDTGKANLAALSQSQTDLEFAIIAEG